MVEVKKCPFCGSDAWVWNNWDEWIWTKTIDGQAWFVSCNNHDTCIARPSVYDKNKEVAIQIWNRRI